MKLSFPEKSKLTVHACEGMKFYRDKAKEAFGLGDYRDASPALFLGIYFKEDLLALTSHLHERKYVFWNGSDVSRTLAHPEWHEPIRKVLAKHACHNAQLAAELATIGINAEVSPILFAPPYMYSETTYVHHVRPRVFMTVHPGREEEYGLSQAVDIFRYLHADLYVYGNAGGSSRLGNIHLRGWIDEDLWRYETAKMQAALRLNKHDGTSQIVIKAILRGQYAIVTPSSWEAYKGLQSLSDEAMPNVDKVPGLNAWITKVLEEEQ